MVWKYSRTGKRGELLSSSPSMHPTALSGEGAGKTLALDPPPQATSHNY